MKTNLKLAIARQFRQSVALFRSELNNTEDFREREKIAIALEEFHWERFGSHMILPARGFKEPVRVLNSGKERIKFGYEEHIERLVTIRIPREMDYRGVTDFVYYALSHSCNHTFDCCGCYQSVAHIFKQVSKREFIVLVRSYRNI